MTASFSSTNQYPIINELDSSSRISVPSKPKLELICTQGQLQVYSSPYRGSFPVVLSEALRSAGLGSNVLIAQFLKGGVAQGIQNGIKLCGNLEWIRPELLGCINYNSFSNGSLLKEDESVKNAIEEIWNFCKERLCSPKSDKIVLDEIGLAIEYGFIQEKELINSLENRQDSIDVILTGPSIPTKVFAMADQVTQLRNSK